MTRLKRDGMFLPIGKGSQIDQDPPITSGKLRIAFKSDELWQAINADHKAIDAIATRQPIP